MEELIYPIISIVSILGLTAVVVAPKLRKSTKKKVKETVSNSQAEAVSMMRETIEEYKRELKRINGQNAQLKRKQDELQGLQTAPEEKRTLNEYSSDEIIALVNTLGIKNVNPEQIATIFNNPMVQDYLSDKTIDDVQEILQFVQPFLKSQGSGQSNDGITQGQQDQTNWA